MNRHRQHGPLDDASSAVGDALFARLDMRGDPAALGPGTVQASENFRFGIDGARPRKGIASRVAPGSAPDAIRFAGIYRPHNSNDRLAFITASRLQLYNPEDQSLTAYNYPGGETVAATDPVDFVQGGIASGTTPSAWILRGLAKDPLKFDGASVTVDTAFPNALFAIYAQDRMAAATGSGTQSQTVSTSDFLDFATWATLSQFQVLYGGDDHLVGLLPYQKDIVVVGARKRFHVAYFAPQYGASGYSGNLSGLNSFLRDLTREAGLVSRRAFLEAGGYVWCLSDAGIYAFQPRLDLELTVLGDPLSGPIQPILDRLNANDADGADAKHLGERIYWALPISDEPLAVRDILATGSAATLETWTAHGCAVGDTIQIRGSYTAALNAQFTVATVPSTTTLTFTTSAGAGSITGTGATVQRLATRNNAIAVFNLSRPYTDPVTGRSYPGAWESIDWLPDGLYADFLLVADDGAQRRLWLIDKDTGPFLYEEGAVDATGDFQGGLRTGARLQAQITGVNRNNVAIAGRLLSRTLRWGGSPVHVKAGETRLTATGGDAGRVTYRVRTPDRPLWESERTFTGDSTQQDTSARKRCGKRGLEGEIEIVTTAGRPAVRSLNFEITAAGRVAEE